MFIREIIFTCARPMTTTLEEHCHELCAEMFRIDEVAERIRVLEEEQVQPVTETIHERLQLLENLRTERRLRNLKSDRNVYLRTIPSYSAPDAYRHIPPFIDEGYSKTPVEWARYALNEFRNPEQAGKMAPREVHTFDYNRFGIAYSN